MKPSSTCPVCRCFIKADDILDLSPTQKAAAAAAKASKELPSFNFQRLTRETLLGDGGDMPWRMSSKLEYLLTDLAAIKQHNDAARRFKRTKQTPSADVDELEAPLESQLSQTVAGMFLEGPVRVVVFSSFTFMLDLIEKCCKTERLSYARLDGSMSQPQREASLKAFRSDADTFVMLISLKAGGLGLNLTEASIVYLMDPWVRCTCCCDEMMRCIHSYVCASVGNCVMNPCAVESEPRTPSIIPCASAWPGEASVRKAIDCIRNDRGVHVRHSETQAADCAQCAQRVSFNGRK